jgi:FixJ family two-component response regulator
MSTPLLQRPGMVCVLDDDEAYLETLAIVLPADWRVKLYSRVDDCLNSLQQEPPRWWADLHAQHDAVGRWRDGQSLIRSVWDYWNNSPERLGFTRFAVFDFAMPKMSGVEAFAELPDWQGGRILLTGQADERVAVQAFNDGLIDQYVPKQTDQLVRYLRQTLDRLSLIPIAAHEEIWRATLSQAQMALLRHPEVRRRLTEALDAQAWSEYVILGQPFGVLGIDAQANVSWLQLETLETLHNLIESAREHGFEHAWVEDMRQGRALLDLELQQALGAEPDTSVQRHALIELSREPQLFGALIALGPQWQLPQAQSQSALLGACSPREVRR